MGTSVTRTVGETRLPSFVAFKDIFWIAALTATGSAWAAVDIRGPQRAPVSGVGAVELVLQGRVLAPDHRPLTLAVVTVLAISGDQVDWSRVDTEGNYSVALQFRRIPHGGQRRWLVAHGQAFELDGRTSP
ncbi:hypothetical protein A6A22_19690 [Arthrobacter sp. OY3WO11]|nr:hypothetical protein A6A22_19690 [Arthrobacter sp. OY3WO11]